MMDFVALAQECAPAVHPVTMAAVAKVESGYNPFAIGVVGGRLTRQPRNKAEAVATATMLQQAGWNFSLGLAQVNKKNLPKYGLNFDSAFEPCSNLRAGAAILKDCYDRAYRRLGDKQTALHAAFSCYYSGNFTTGFRPDFKGQPSYVVKVLNAAGQPAPATASIAVIPAPGKPRGKPVPAKPAAAPTQDMASPQGGEQASNSVLYDGYGSGLF